MTGRRGGAEVKKVERFVENGQAGMVGTVTRLRGGRSGIRTHSLEKDVPPIKLRGGGHAHTMAQFVEARRYKPEGCGLDSRLCHLNFSFPSSLTISLESTQLATDMGTRNLF